MMGKGGVVLFLESCGLDFGLKSGEGKVDVVVGF